MCGTGRVVMRGLEELGRKEGWDGMRALRVLKGENDLRAGGGCVAGVG